MGSLSASENEYSAEETLITVTSLVEHPPFFFISGHYGPMNAGLPCDLPLWLAITLRKKSKCTIQIPDWMSVEALERNVERERRETEFEALPFHFIEISQLLLTNAREDVPMADKVAALLQDLENIRMDRARVGLLAMAESIKSGAKVEAININNISGMEIQTIRRFFTQSLAMCGRLTTSSEARRTVRSGEGAFANDGDDGGAPRNLRRLRRK